MPHAILGTIEPDAAFYARIGRIAAEWSWVERLLDEMLAYFCRSDPGSMYVISQGASNSSIVQWLRVLAQIHVQSPPTMEVFHNLFNEIDAIRTERNVVVHGLWQAGDEPSIARVHTLRWDRAEVVRDETWSIADLDALITDIQRMQHAIGSIGVKLGFITPESN